MGVHFHTGDSQIKSFLPTKDWETFEDGCLICVVRNTGHNILLEKQQYKLTSLGEKKKVRTDWELDNFLIVA